MRAYTEIDGDTATVRAGSAAEHEQLARVLLEAAGPDRKREVRGTSTGGKGFRVPLDIAKTAGLIPDAAEPEDAAPDGQDFAGQGTPAAPANLPEFNPLELPAEEPTAEPVKEQEPKKTAAKKAPAKKAAPQPPADGGDA